MTLALYLPALRHDFLNYDDQQYVTENPHVKAGLTLKSLAWAFGFHAGNWHPLTWISHMLDCQLYGLNPTGHHLTNALLHAATTVLLFLVFSRMTGSLWPSALVAGFFGWHPLHVESVAWVAERKDVLCGLFWMATLWAYVRYAEKVQERAQANFEIRNPKSETNSKSAIWKASAFYALALFLFALGLMSKPMAVTLPFVLLLMDYWPLERILGMVNLGRLLAEKLPFFVLSTVACWLTVMAQARAGAVVPISGLPISARFAHALISYAHYIGAMFWPRHLAVYYPYETSISPSESIGAAILLGIISIVAIWYAKRLPYVLVGWLWFLGTLVPVIGLVQVGEQAWADRYTYLPSIGIFLAGVWVVAEKLQAPRSARFQFAAASAIGTMLLIVMSIQLRYWKNTRTLFEHTAAATWNNYMAVTLLGSLDAKEGKLNEAIERYKTALNWKPQYPEAHFFLGNALDQQGNLDEAIEEYNKALWFKPVQTHLFLGAALAKQRKNDEAKSHYLAALNLNPESAVGHNNLAKLLQTEGRLDEAMEHYVDALRLDPDLAQAHNNLGVLLLGQGSAAEGVRELREALRLQPGDLETEYNLGAGLNQQQRWSEAAEFLGKVLEKKGNEAGAHHQLGIALVHLGKTRDAMSHYASALLIQRDFPDALDGLSWILATSPNEALRNGVEAVRMAQRACELTGRKDAQKLRTLAAAYAEVSQFNEAVSTMQTVTKRLPGKANANSPDEEQMLEAFKANRPWRDPGIK